MKMQAGNCSLNAAVDEKKAVSEIFLKTFCTLLIPGPIP